MNLGCAPVTVVQTNTSVPTTQATTPPQTNTTVPTIQATTPPKTNTAVPITQAVAPTQAAIQSLPNTGQQISPLAVEGSKFENLNPDLADNPNWLAGQAVTSVVSPDKKTLLVLTSGYNRVFRSDGTPDALGTYFNWPD